MHPSDAELQALIDNELDEREWKRVRAHLESCAACRDRKQALESLLDETAQLLGALDLPAYGSSVEEVIRVAGARSRAATPREGRSLLRAASLAGLLIAGAVAAAVVPGSPFREAAMNMIREPAGEENVPSRVADPWRQEAGVALLSGGALEVVFQAGQSEGSLQLVMTREDTTRVDVRGDSVGFVVGDGSILVRNQGARASYRIAVPTDLESVRISIGPRTVFEMTGGEVVSDRFRREGGARTLSLSEAP